MKTNSTIESILSRKSTRAFDSSKKIPSDELEAIVSCAYHAPSGMNRQKWHFTVVTDAETIKKLYRTVGQALNRDAGYCFYDPSAFIITSNEADNVFGAPDNACALENVFVAAQSFGISSVWINQLNDCCDEPEVRALLTELKVPENHRVFGCAALGYPPLLEADKNKFGRTSGPTPKNDDVVDFI